MVLTNLLQNNASISKVRHNLAIGIADMIMETTENEKDLEKNIKFRKSISVNEEGRYEFALLWTDGYFILSD